MPVLESSSDNPSFVPGFHQRLVELLTVRLGLADPVREPVLHLLERPGKGLRPALAFAVAEACAGSGAAERPAIMAVATAGELLHLAALIHDDVIDEAELRRGRPALHRAFGAHTAVLAGDYLIGAAYALLGEDASGATLKRAAGVVHAMAAAELAELAQRGHPTDLAQTQSIAAGKTGTLFAWIAAAAATECGEWAGENAWHTWGMTLGLLFQLADDLGDALGIAEGKDTGRDAATATPTLLSALATAGSDALTRTATAWIAAAARPPARGPRLKALSDFLIARTNARIDAWHKRQE